MSDYHKPAPSDWREADAEYERQLDKSDRIADTVHDAMVNLSCANVHALLADADGNISPLAALAADILFRAAADNRTVRDAIRDEIAHRVERGEWEE